MRIQVLEPYFTGSHRQWAEGLARHSRHDVELLTHAGQFWKWRLGGGFVTMAEQVSEHIARHGSPDLVVASSMLDLAGLLGLARRDLEGVPAAVYFHENQITYPETGRTRAEAALGMANWAALLAADGVAFNSRFHLDSVFDALPGFLGAFPDRRHDYLVERVHDRCTVVPVGVDLERIGDLRPRSGSATFLWNHRWDPDKALDEALAALVEVADSGADFRLILAGESFVDQPSQHEEAIGRLGDKVVHVGYLDDAAYVDALHLADAVISTATQEFFGVSVIEAMYAGAFPVLPNCLVYPQRVPGVLGEAALYRGRGGLAQRIGDIARDVGGYRARATEVRTEAARYDWSVVGPLTDAWMESVAGK